MTFLETFDMYLIFVDTFKQYFKKISKYLVMYLVTGLKGLPGGGRFGLSRGLDPPRVIIMECRVS